MAVSCVVAWASFLFLFHRGPSDIHLWWGAWAVEGLGFVRVGLGEGVCFRDWFLFWAFGVFRRFGVLVLVGFGGR